MLKWRWCGALNTDPAGVVACVAANGGKVVPSVTVHVIDAVSGRTLESRTHRSATGPVNVLMHENWIQYTYWNHKSKLQELSSLVLYEGSVGKYVRCRALRASAVNT